MKINDEPPLTGQIAIRLKQTSRKPTELIGTLRDGRRLHIVATATNLLISTGPGLTDALLKAKAGDVEKVRHKDSSDLSAEAVLAVTGLKLGPDVDINEAVPGDIL